MGSVKELEIMKNAFENQPGTGFFTFTDDYSVFDWGKMPNQIPGKGAALLEMSKFNFKMLEEADIPHHMRLSSRETNKMSINLFNVYEPIKRFMSEKSITYDYSLYDHNRGTLDNYLIPLEIIFRNGLPLGSSVFRKVEEANAIQDEQERKYALAEIWQKLGVGSTIHPGEWLPHPVIEFTTKLEDTDRKLSEVEAYLISGLTQQDFEKIRPLAMQVNNIITQQAGKAGIAHFDGKIELGYSNGDLTVVDTLGTFDENRFVRIKNKPKDNQQVSKEVLRQWYITHQPEWVDAMKEAKKSGPGWQERCEVEPKQIPKLLANLVGEMYQSGANMYMDKQVFRNARPLSEIMHDINVYIKK